MGLSWTSRWRVRPISITVTKDSERITVGGRARPVQTGNRLHGKGDAGRNRLSLRIIERYYCRTTANGAPLARWTVALSAVPGGSSHDPRSRVVSQASAILSRSTTVYGDAAHEVNQNIELHVNSNKYDDIGRGECRRLYHKCKVTFWTKCRIAGAIRRADQCG
jgi:hypothetical protein